MGCSILWLTFTVNAWFVPVQQGYCCCIFFKPMSSILYVMWRTAGVTIDYAQTFRDYHAVNKLKTLMGFNAIFAILKKGIISRANVFKCGRRTKVPPQPVPLRASDPTNFKMVSSEVSLAAFLHNFNILQREKHISYN